MKYLQTKCVVLSVSFSTTEGDILNTAGREQLKERGGIRCYWENLGIMTTIKKNLQVRLIFLQKKEGLPSFSVAFLSFKT